ncbi:MAG: hypothetical protein GKS00_20445 [Alphaproteobacteria bacterium]|nr:hypothetical protein [Alphaproteobacteria bacterium]
MSMQSRWIHELKWPEIADYLKRSDIALIPVGATEQHGPHLPLYVDTGWAVGMAEGAAERADALIAPPMHYGWGPHHMAYPGTVTLRADTLVQVCMDIGESLVYHGFKKLVFINGNRAANLPPMEMAVSKLRFQTGAFAAVADAGLMAKSAVHDVCDAAEGGLGHAGESETAYTLYRNPELVDMSLAVDAEHKPGRFTLSHKPMEPPFDGDSAYVPRTDGDMRRSTEATQGIAGSASLATREKGERIHQILSDALVDFIETHVRPTVVELKDVKIPT